MKIKMEIVYYWHSFVEILTDFGSILIDPFITNNASCPITVKDVYKKKIIAVINTHWHIDHIGDTANIAHESKCKVVATFELAMYHKNKNYIRNIIPMHIWGEFKFKKFSVKFVNAVHGGGIGEYPFENWKAAWVIVRINWKNIYHAGDTALTYDMKLLWDYDNIDVALLPIWWVFTMWVDDAVVATKLIKPKIVVPIHYNTWETIKADPQIFAKKIMQENVSNPKVLLPSQSIVL